VFFWPIQLIEDHGEDGKTGIWIHGGVWRNALVNVFDFLQKITEFWKYTANYI